MNMKKEGIYERIAPVNALNNVPGFDPRRFLRRTVSESGLEVLCLDLRYRKLWFRLKYPEGRIVTTARRLTKDIAVFETRVYFERDASVPNAVCTATNYAAGQRAALYVQRAQDASIGGALNDAGFGLQFCDVSGTPDFESTGGEVVQTTTPVVAPAASEKRTELRITQNTAPEKRTEPRVAPAPAPVVKEAPATSESAAAETKVEPASTLPVEDAVAETTAADEPPADEVNETATPGEEYTATVENAVAPESAPQDEIAAIMKEVAGAVEVTATGATAKSDAAGSEVTTSVATELDASRFTPDMPADEIQSSITLEEAAAVVVDFGLCKGKTLAEVAETRMASLKFFATGYNGENNLVRAAARVLCKSYEPAAA